MTTAQSAKLAVIATFVATLAGCGGGGGSGAPSSVGTIPTVPTTNGQTVTLQAQSSSVTLPTVGGYTGTITMPPGSGTVTITTAVQPPAGIPAPATFAPLMYVNFSAAAGSVSMSQMPAFAVAMSSMMGSQSYYMAQYQNGTWMTAEGPAMMSGSSMMMNAGATPISMAPGQQACFAYYMGSPLPSAMPSASPTAMPTM